MVRRSLSTLAFGAFCALLGVLNARCEHPSVLSPFPPMDLCCWCLATHETSRGTRCSRGTITECIHDMATLDIATAETNPRCLRTVCGPECGPLAAVLPSEEATVKCCDCLSSSRRNGVACYPGTSEECTTELDELELAKFYQGDPSCVRDICQTKCKDSILGVAATMDAGQAPDASTEEPDAGGGTTEDAGTEFAGRDSRPPPPLGWWLPAVVPVFLKWGR